MTKSSFAALVFIVSCIVVAAARPIGARPVNDRVLGVAPPQATVRFIVHLPLRDEAGAERLVEMQSDLSSPLYGHFLTPQQFRAAYGPTPSTMRIAAEALRAAGFGVERASTQSLYAFGSVATASRAFGARFETVMDAFGATRIETRSDVRELPALARLGATVHGISGTADALPGALNPVRPENRQSTTGPYWFDDLKQAYKYPSYTTAHAAGAVIATVGLSEFSNSDAALYFGHELLGSKSSDLAPAPKATNLAYAGALKFKAGNGASDEANLDVQQAGGSAPGATIVGVAVPNLSSLGGFLMAYDDIVDNSLFDIVSTSYGGCELLFTKSYNNGHDYTSELKSFHDEFVQGNSEGITFVFSSGDNAGLECPQVAYFQNRGKHLNYKYVASVSFWADDPNVTAVGGTNLVTAHHAGSLQSTYVGENAYADPLLPSDPYGVGNQLVNGQFGSGGGKSAVWASFPAQKSLTGSTMRLLPDVSMQMGGCPVGAKTPCGSNRSATVAAVGGKFLAFVGTSASAPEFAGLLGVRVGIAKKRLGNVNAFIYTASAHNSQTPYFHQGIPGNNGVISWPKGKTGYNVITGNGTPHGYEYVLLPHAALAGNPQTASNP